MLSARTLAWSGGIVTLLGVVLLFVLAVNRGWIGPWERVGIGAAASLAVFVGGILLRRRFGVTHSALAAVGAGIAGAYCTLLAAAALYGLVPDLGALGLALAIAAVGVALSISWSSEIVAGLGLIGAMLVPVAVVFDSGLTVLGVSFVGVVLAATALVGVNRRWRTLLTVGACVSLPQIAGLIADAETPTLRLVILAVTFWLLYLAIGVVEQLRAGTPALERHPVAFVLGSGVFGALAAGHLFSGTAHGVSQLAAASVYVAAAAVFFGRRSTRDLSALLWGVGLTVGAIALTHVVSGQTLATVWAAEAALLAWLAWRTREIRFQGASIAYLVLAAWHAFALDAPIRHLFVFSAQPARGAVSLVAVAVAAVVLALNARAFPAVDPPGGVFRSFAPILEELRLSQAVIRVASLLAAAAISLYAVGLGVLELGVALGADRLYAFDWGHVGIDALWAVVGAVSLFVGLRRPNTVLRLSGLAWLAVALAKVVLYDLPFAAQTPHSVAALLVGAIVLAAGIVDQVLGRRGGLGATALTGVAASVYLAVTAIGQLAVGQTAWLLVLGAASVYGLLAAALFRRPRERDLTTLLWVTALALGGVAAGGLLDGTLLVLAWAATGTALAWLSRRTGEARLQLGATAFVAAGLAHVLILDAPPSNLFVATGHPGTGVAALLLVAVASAVFARYSNGAARRAGTWLAAGLGVYAVSLSILEAAEWIGRAGVQADFQHGHTVVSAFWGLLGLAALYGGLRRSWRMLQLTGFAIFGLSLVKIFVYDLAALSSIARAFSFLAVGAVLLLGGFFYQRLSDRHGPNGAAAPG